MDNVAKISKVETTKVVDMNGEITEETTSVSFNYGKETDYIKVYLDNIVVLAEIQGWISKVLYELIKGVTYANKRQFIIINSGYKRIVAENLGIKQQSVTNAVNQLTKKIS